MIKFGDLKVGDKFRYGNNTFTKTQVVDRTAWLYNATTDELGQSPWSYWKVVYLSDDQRVRQTK